MEQKNKPPALVGSVYRSKYINIEGYPYSHFAEMKLGYKSHPFVSGRIRILLQAMCPKAL